MNRQYVARVLLHPRDGKGRLVPPERTPSVYPGENLEVIRRLRLGWPRHHAEAYARQLNGDTTGNGEHSFMEITEFLRNQNG